MAAKPPAQVSVGVWQDRFSEVAFSPAGTLIVASTNPLEGDKHIIAWSYPSLAERWRVPTAATITATCFARTGEWVATCELKGATVVRDIATGREIRGVEASTGCQPAVALDADRLVFFTRTDDNAGRLAIWNLRTGEAERAIDGLPAAIRDLVVDARGERVAVAVHGSAGPNVMVIEISSFRMLHDLAGASSARLAGFRANDAELVAYNTHACGPAIHDSTTGRVIVVLGNQPLAEIHAVALSASGRWLATSHGMYLDNHRPYEDQCLCIWDLVERRLHSTIAPDTTSPPTTLGFVADDALLAAEYGAPITIRSYRI